MPEELGILGKWLEEARAEGLKQAFEQAVEEARETGRRQGREEEARRFTRVCLSSWFGPVPPRLSEQLETADIAWCEALLEFAGCVARREAEARRRRRSGG